MSFKAPRILPALTVVTCRRASPWSSSGRPTTPTRASSRRSSTCTCRSRSCALVGFMVAAVQAILHLRSGDSKWDVRSYVSIHISVIFGVAVLLTGAIWAKASWGKWLVWDEPTLVSFLIVFLLYCTYYPLRYAIEDRERQARYASVFAITAGAFVPLNFIAVRLAETLVHPRVFATADGGLPPKMTVTFLVCFAGDGAALGDAGALRARREVLAARIGRLRRALEGERRRRRRARGSRRSPRGGRGRADAARCRSTRPASTSPAPTSSSSPCC